MRNRRLSLDTGFKWAGGSTMVLMGVLAAVWLGRAFWSGCPLNGHQPGEPAMESGNGQTVLEGELAAPTTTASAPTTAPAEPWRPPRFTRRLKERLGMVEVIRAYGLADATVLRAMTNVPRHEFVPPAYSSRAYADSPLPIGYGQTISQPYIVAEMTRLLQLRPDSRVLEIGTGSGYQAAVLSELTPRVFTIEIVKPLADSARRRLRRLGYNVVHVRHGDGYFGWPEQAPFEGIIVTCAAGQIPPALLGQLAPGGRMVIPVGPPLAIQSLMLVIKRPDGSIRSRSLMPVRFVPLLREDPTNR